MAHANDTNDRVAWQMGVEAFDGETLANVSFVASGATKLTFAGRPRQMPQANAMINLS
jgi:hypothetical protein